MHAAFYISGHGFGHSTRAIVTIEALAKRGHRVTVVTVSPSLLFDPLLSAYPNLLSVRRDSRALDPGIIQKDAVTVDSKKSMADMWAFLLTREERCEQEVSWLSQSGIDCVVLDAPFIPGVAARRCGIPSILISNFSFDSIFDGFLGLDSSLGEQARAVCVQVREMYAHTDYLLRLPGAIPSPLFDGHRLKDAEDMKIWEFGAFERAVADAAEEQDRLTSPVIPENVNFALQQLAEANKRPPPRLLQSHEVFELLQTMIEVPERARVYNIPLIVRTAMTPREAFRSSLGIPLQAKVVLITFGGHNVTASTPDRAPSPVRHHPPNSLTTTKFVQQAIASMETLAVEKNASNVQIHVTQESATSSPVSTLDHLIPADWHAIIAVPGPKGDLLDDYIEFTDPSRITLTTPSAYVPDLLQASDVAVGKCGYGTCGEVIAHHVPFVYVPRPAFVEEVGLINNLMKPFGVSTEMSQKDFYSGNWACHILKAYELGKKGPAARIQLNGAEVAAECIENIVLVRRSIIGKN
ncbi:hypothetical protein BC830DRAFT_1119669 [Chytriomyces sp. MP71]|nr:hypothetical protein BC830DRAFT_1119669 [Chytriomyces sp. MP71]